MWKRVDSDEGDAGAVHYKEIHAMSLCEQLGRAVLEYGEVEDLSLSLS